MLINITREKTREKLKLKEIRKSRIWGEIRRANTISPVPKDLYSISYISYYTNP